VKATAPEVSPKTPTLDHGGSADGRKPALH